jgi:anion exchange protein
VKQTAVEDFNISAMSTSGDPTVSWSDEKQNNKEYMDQAESPLNSATSPLLSTAPSFSRVRSIIEDEDEGRLTLISHTLFTQLDVLVHFPDGRVGWKEMTRWLKYQETVETGDRWSKPHVPTTSMHSLTEMRRVMASGECAIGLGISGDSKKTHYLGEGLINTIKANSRFEIGDREAQLILETVLKPHKHMNRKASKNKQATDGSVPLQNQASVRSQYEENNNEGEKAKKSLLRRRSGEIEIATCYHDYPKGATPDNLKPYKPNAHLRKKLPKDCEGANILIGQVDFLKETIIAFCRFDEVSTMADLTEIDVPTRFILLALGPMNGSNIWELTELGRAMGSLLNDKVFCEVAYRAKTRQDLVDGIDEFIDDLTVLPPSIWDPSTRLEPPQHTPSTDKILLRLDESKRQKGIPESPEQEEGAPSDESLKRTGRICGGLIHDVKHRYRHYLSDFKDGLHIQCLASTIFLFFACITPIVTFGGLMGQKTHNYMGTIECLLSGAICGFTYAVFAGQPLTIVGATGPLLVFESILYYLCDSNGVAFMPMRFWVGFWVMILLLVIVIFDLSFLVRYITRFTEESFSILISVIFIYEAFTKVYEIFDKYSVHTGTVREDPSLGCYCYPTEYFNKTFPNNTYTNSTNGEAETFGNFSWTEPSNWTYYFRENCVTNNNRVIVRRDCISEKSCLTEWHGELAGDACYMKNITQSIPDVFFLSLILFIGTFTLAMAFRNFRTSLYLTKLVRNTVADFAVFLSVVTWTGIDYAFGISTPKLNVPEKFVTTIPERGWIINPFAVQGWVIPLTIVPALLATILVFLDQQITTVIVNRKEHKLKKGHGYHLDLLVIAVLIGICSLLGLPWFVAATVRALTHVKSLIRISEVSIPGEKPQMIGVREQRVTGICIHLLIGFSTLLTAVLKIIPMPVLYGVFLYMGFTSLSDVQFIERFAILFMPAKYQPDYIFLRHVKTSRVHIFTIVQLVCFIGMWMIKTIKTTSIAFPVMLIVLMAARKCMDFIFTQSELYWLDHLLPEAERRAEEDSKTKRDVHFVINGDRLLTKEEEATGMRQRV